MADVLTPDVVQSQIPLGVRGATGPGGASASFSSMNPIEMMQGIARLQLMGNQNNLFQQTFEAQKALGPLAQQAVGEDGNIDWDKYAEIVSKDPRTAFRAPEILASIAQRKQAQVAMQGQQLEQALTVQRSAHTALASLLAKPEPTSDDVYAAATQYVTSAPPELQPRLAKSVAAMIVDAPRADQKGDPQNFPKQSQALKEWAMKHFAQSGQTMDQLEAMAGRIGLTDTGSGFTATKTNPGLGTVTALGQINKDMSPTDLNTIVPGAGPGGAGAVRGQLPIVGGATPPGTVLGGPGTTSAAGPTAASGITPIGPNEAMKSAFHAGGEAAAKQEAAINETVKTSIPLVQRIGEEIEALKGFQAGPGETTRARLAEAAETLGWHETSKEILRGDLKDVHEYESLIAQQAIETLKQALGGQGRITNLEVDQFFKRYPNLSTDPGAIEKIYNFTKKISEQYYNEQQGLVNFRQLMKAGKLPAGTDMTDFPAWYSKQMVQSGAVNFKPTYGEAKGSTLKPPGGATPGTPKRSLDDIFKDLK